MWQSTQRRAIYKSAASYFKGNQPTEKLNCYWSRSLTDTKQRFDFTQRECPALVWPALLLRLYLEYQGFTIITDQDTLKRMLNLAEWAGRTARCRLCLSEFDFDVIYRTGIKHQHTDKVSRLSPTDKEEIPKQRQASPSGLAPDHDCAHYRHTWTT